MTPFLIAVSAYAVWHLLRCTLAVWRDTYPRKCNLGLYALGVWAAYLLVA